MDNNDLLREQLIRALQGGNAHMTLEDAIEDFPVDKINDVFPHGTYSSWQLFEHIRRTQFDILNFIANPEYEELSWPEDYWPSEKQVAQKEWNETIIAYQKDLSSLVNIVKHEDLYKKIPHGTGQILLREILLVIDHTSYHTGEFAIMRQIMNTWGKKH